MTVNLPSKLTPDMIQEALFEARFEHSELIELVIGKLATEFQKPGWSAVRLPVGEIPDVIREGDAALRILPTIELRSEDGAEIIRIGPHVVSHHIVGGYVGWDNFQPRLLATVAAMQACVPSISPVRLGLRYLNAPTPKHGIASIWDLNLGIEAAGSTPASDVQLVYRVIEGTDLEGLVRVVTSSFIEEASVSDAVAVIDIDMFTPDSTASVSMNSVGKWLEKAHDAEKRIFFGLLKDQTVAVLREN
jgi:uncharacterized protein (TIGR04255 family)